MIYQLFPTDDLSELTSSRPGEGFDGYILVDQYLSDADDWNHYWTLIFKYGAKYFKWEYTIQHGEGLVEDGDEAECIEVRPVEVMKTIYEAV